MIEKECAECFLLERGTHFYPVYPDSELSIVTHSKGSHHELQLKVTFDPQTSHAYKAICISVSDTPITGKTIRDFGKFTLPNQTTLYVTQVNSK